jgi:type IV pilus assembly protein PilO
MQEMFDKLAATPLIAKIGALVGVLVLLGAGYWYFFYSDLTDEEAQVVKRTGELTTEKKDYEKRKKEYLAFVNERNKLLEEQKELLQVLPQSDDMEQFIESVQAQVELSGLTKVSSQREAPISMDLYKKIPIRMSAVGSYHQINQFFKAVGDLKRIVNIEDLQLSSAGESKDPNKTPLKATFVATTFQYIDKPGGARKTTTTISAGGKCCARHGCSRLLS